MAPEYRLVLSTNEQGTTIWDCMFYATYSNLGIFTGNVKAADMQTMAERRSDQLQHVTHKITIQNNETQSYKSKQSCPIGPVVNVLPYYH